MIKVLRIIARMNVGGPAAQIVSLAEGLDPHLYDHRVLTGDLETGEADHLRLRAPHVKPIKVPGLARSVRGLGDVVALANVDREIRRFRPDIVHTHTAKAGVLGRLAAAAERVPHTVHTFHGHLLEGYFSAPVTSAITLVERVLATRTSRLVAVGRQVRDDLLDVGIGRADQFSVIPPGLDIFEPPPQEEARRLLSLPQDRPIVAFVARLTAIKRPDRFLATAEQVLREHPDTLFLVAGDGPLLSELRQQSIHLGPGMRFLGWRADVEVVYGAADLVLLTSDNEGMPVSLIEASMSGVPCVTTDVGSAREVVLDGETGYAVGPAVSELASAVSALLSDEPLRHRMGERARERARSEFSAARLVADTDRLYRSLLDS